MYRFLKPILDGAAAAVCLLILWPFMLLLAAVIRIDSPGPVLFRQRRAGRGDRLFTIYKFRTMRIDTPRDMPTHMLAGAARHITRVGGFLRRSSLDELPQLLNILFGQMSFVGPRPALWNQDDLIALRRENGADRVRPGLTGWAQVNGRDELPIAEKAALDGYYAANFSPVLDVRILWRTALQVFRGSGVVEGATRS
ncbi:MAG: sugar transferase [Clostridia bacterium]|nr:sugar transferase [Clostridia bacterium]